MKKSKKWLQLLFAFVESQLSNSIFSKESHLESQLHDNIDFLFPDHVDKEEKKELLLEALNKKFSIDANLSEEEYLAALDEARSRLITFKEDYFDQPRKILKPQVSDTLKQGVIPIWKPIWEYLISQIEDLYRFEGRQFLVLPEKQMYLRTITPIQKLLRKFIGKKIYKIKDPIKNQLCSIISPSSSISKEEYLKTIFPNRELLMSNLAGYYYSMGKPVVLGRINPFYDEEVGVLYHQKLINDYGLKPIYLQFGNAIEVFEKDIKNDRCKKIVSKESNNNPLIYFEEGEVVFVPYQEVKDNKVAKELMNIEITSLNSLDIINNYLRRKFELDD